MKHWPINWFYGQFLIYELPSFGEYEVAPLRLPTISGSERGDQSTLAIRKKWIRELLLSGQVRRKWL